MLGGKCDYEPKSSELASYGGPARRTASHTQRVAHEHRLPFHSGVNIGVKVMSLGSDTPGFESKSL